MYISTPHIFVSATTADLAAARKVVADALIEVRCFPEVQQHFQTGEGNISVKEVDEIAGCAALIHLAGWTYGAEPSLREVPRRSYTQREYHAAKALKKPVYLFLPTKTFYATVPNLPKEDTEKQELQRAHCERLRAGDDLWYEFSSLEELRGLILKLPAEAKEWQKLFKKERTVSLAVALILAGLSSGGTGLVVHDLASTRKAIEKVEWIQKKHTDSLVDIRQTLEEVKAMTNSSIPSDEQLMKVAEAHGLTKTELVEQFHEFMKSVEASPDPSPKDKELSNYVSKFIMLGFTRDEFEAYVNQQDFSKWKPSFVVLHHTATPLAQWRKNPDRGLRNFFELFVKEMKWKGGPHVFVDGSKIWVFNSLTQPGVHARDWNDMSLGVELIGDYDKEALEPEVRDMAIDAIAALHRKLELPASTLRFHREQGPDRTRCPGTNVSKEDFVARIQAILDPSAPATAVQSAETAPAPSTEAAKPYELAIKQKIIKIVLEQLGVNADQVTDEARLVDDLGADSLDLVELIMGVEEEFEVVIPDEKAEKLTTVGDIMRYVDSLR